MFNTIYNEIKLRKRIMQWTTLNNCEFVIENSLSKCYNKLGIDSVLLAEPELHCYIDSRRLVRKTLNTFCDLDEYSKMNSNKLGQMIQNFSDLIVESLGISKPQIYCTFNSKVTQYCLATSDTNNSVHYYPQIAKSIADFDEELNVGLPLNIAHENEHLRQFALAKMYFKGAKIPQFDEFCILLGFMCNANLAEIGNNTMGKIGEKEQQIYTCDPFEIIARYKSYKTIRFLSKYSKVKCQEKLNTFLNDILLYDNIYNECCNVSEIFEPATEEIIKTFKENFGQTVKGCEILNRLDSLDKKRIYKLFQLLFDDQINEAKARDIYVPPENLELQVFTTKFVSEPKNIEMAHSL